VAPLASLSHGRGEAMSRFARTKETPTDVGTPIWVWVVYALGLLAVAIILLSLAFSAVVYLSSDDDAAFDVNVSVPALVLWAALVLLAAATLVWRRRGGGR
jgi:hypothetical protein